MEEAALEGDLKKNTSLCICAVLRVQLQCYRLIRCFHTVGLTQVKFLSGAFKLSLLESQQKIKKIKVVSHEVFEKWK